MPRYEIDAALGLESLRRQLLDRLEQADERALVVDRAAAPHRLFSDRPRKGRVFPVAFGALGDRHDILMRHDDDRRERRVAARPVIDERPVRQDRARHDPVRRRIGGREPAMQPVPFGNVIVGRVLVRNRLDLRRGAQMPDGGVEVIGRHGGEPDVAAVGDVLGRESRGAYGHRPRNHRDDRKTAEQNRPPLPHVPLLLPAQWRGIGFDLQGKFGEMVGPAGLEPAT